MLTLKGQLECVKLIYVVRTLDCDAGRIYEVDLCCFKLGCEIVKELRMKVEGY